MNKKGICIVVTGASAVGKTSVVKHLLKQIPGSARLITTTSRNPRPGEIDGVDYNFVSRQHFKRLIKAEKFLEWEETYGNLYGSERAILVKMLKEHPVVFVILDVRGAKSYQKVFPDARIIALFVPPEQIKGRILGRAPMDALELKRRIEAAIVEQKGISVFDFVVKNQDGRLETETIPLIKKFILEALAE
jgi:guanylate kinase